MGGLCPKKDKGEHIITKLNTANEDIKKMIKDIDLKIKCYWNQAVKEKEQNHHSKSESLIKRIRLFKTYANRACGVQKEIEITWEIFNIFTTIV